MSDDLRALVEALEKEEKSLLQLIDEAVKEQEYLSAHYHFRALERTRSQLWTLKIVDDPFYHAKEYLSADIQYWRLRLETQSPDEVKSWAERTIESNEKELHELNQRTEQSRNKAAAKVLTGYLELFVKKKIRGLRIILNKSLNVQIEIRRTRGGVKLSIPNIRKLKRDSILSRADLKKLKGLGFELNGREEKMAMILQGGKFELVKKIEIVLSLMVFEVFFWREGKNGSFIEVIGTERSK